MKKLLSSVVILFVAVMLIATPVLATAENATAVPAQEGTIATEKYKKQIMQQNLHK